MLTDHRGEQTDAARMVISHTQLERIADRIEPIIKSEGLPTLAP